MDDMYTDVEEIEEDTMYGKYFTFVMEDLKLGFEIKYVSETIDMQDITYVPNLPDYFIGVINLRGRIIPVINLRLKFNHEVQVYDDRTCIIIVEFSDMIVGVIVDKILEVININDENLLEPPDSRIGFLNKYIKKVCNANNDVIIILNIEKLLLDKDYAT